MAEYARKLHRPTALVIHRFALLGILDENGIPVEDMSIVAHDAGNVLPLRVRSAGVIDTRPGKRCPESSNHAVIRKDGCDFCSACGAGRVWVGTAFRRRQGPVPINCIETNHGDSLRPHERPERYPSEKLLMKS